MHMPVHTETIVYPMDAGHQPEPASATPVSAIARSAFRRRESGRGSAILFTSARCDTAVSYLTGCVAEELARTIDRVLLADARVVLQLAKQSPAIVEQLPEPLAGGRLWSLGQQQLRYTRGSGLDPASTGTGDVIRALLAGFNHVVIDAGFSMSYRDIRGLAAETDGIVLVARSGCTTEQELLRCARSLTDVGGRIVGSVLTA